MSMSVAPESSPQVQRQVEPVVQRAGGGNQASLDLESRLNGSKGGGNALAPEVRAFMEPRFGADFSAVRVHTDGEAVQMNQELGAQAFAHGSDVYFGPGKSPGNDELTAHELTHVVQQGGGLPLVQEKQEMGKPPEADVISNTTVTPQNQRIFRSPSLEIRRQLQVIGGKFIQRAPVDTAYGKFKDDSYTTVKNSSGQERGVEITLKFEPGDNVDAKKIGLTQSVKDYKNNKPNFIDPSDPQKIVDKGQGAGYTVDRIFDKNNPIYGTPDLKSGEGLDKSAETNVNSTYELGYRYQDAGTLKKKDAWLYDQPQSSISNDSGQVFETTALAIEGAQQGTYYGSVQWGWTRDSAGKFTQLPLTLVSQSVPSQNFLAPAAKWNAAKTRGTVVVTADNTDVYKANLTIDFQVAKDTKVNIQGAVGAGGVTYNSVGIVDGTHAGKIGYIKVADLTDKGDGAATADLPLVDVYIINNTSGVVLNDGLVGPYRTPTLPRGTRLQVIQAFSMDPQFANKSDVKVVNGSETGSRGWVNTADITKENP